MPEDESKEDEDFDVEELTDISDEELHDLARYMLKRYLIARFEPTRFTSKKDRTSGTHFQPINPKDDPTLGLVLSSYISLVSQDANSKQQDKLTEQNLRLSEQNVRLQWILALFAGISAASVVVQAIPILSKILGHG